MPVFPGRGRCLDALAVALGQASEGTWYTSTLELQLVSFQACVACRDMRTLRVTVVRRMPLSLWGDEGTVGFPLEATRKRQVPALRAAAIAWKLPIGMLVPELSEAPLVREVKWMRVVGVDCQYVKANSPAFTASRRHRPWRPLKRRVHSPRRVFEEMMTKLDGKGHAIDTSSITCSISWPIALRQLSLGCVPNVAIDWGALPSSIERLALGGFVEPITSITWPVSLKRLSLGGGFNQSIGHVVWPEELLSLTFGDAFNQPISGVDVLLPASLLQLTLGESFNQPIIDVVWPPRLPQLFFGSNFNHPIAGVVWPKALLNLTFGGEFNQPIEEVVWPALLLRLSFGYRFHQPIKDVVWPAALRCLLFGDRFDQPIVDVVWPITLHTIVFGEDFSRYSDQVMWPASLWSMAVRDRNGGIRHGEPWPPSSEPVTIQVRRCSDDDTFDIPPRKDSFDHPKTISAGVWAWVARG